MIQSIEEVGKRFPNWYDPNSEMSYEDQKWIWENTPLPPADVNGLQNNNTNVNGSDNGARQLEVDSDSTTSKLHAIEDLKKCDYQTHPVVVAGHLERLFSKFETKNGHWLWIAQRYTVRSINQVIAEIIKTHRTRKDTVRNPAAMFTFLIKKRKKRKIFRSTNGVCGLSSFSGGIK